MICAQAEPISSVFRTFPERACDTSTTHRRSTRFPLSRTQLFECLLEDQVEEHVVPAQDAGHCAVRLNVDVDAAVHVLRYGNGLVCTSPCESREAYLFEFWLGDSGHGGWLRGWIGRAKERREDDDASMATLLVIATKHSVENTSSRSSPTLAARPSRSH